MLSTLQLKMKKNYKLLSLILKSRFSKISGLYQDPRKE